jgi:hypothetical protein
LHGKLLFEARRILSAFRVTAGEIKGRSRVDLPDLQAEGRDKGLLMDVNAGSAHELRSKLAQRRYRLNPPSVHVDTCDGIAPGPGRRYRRKYRRNIGYLWTRADSSGLCIGRKARFYAGFRRYAAPCERRDGRASIEYAQETRMVAQFIERITDEMPPNMPPK